MGVCLKKPPPPTPPARGGGNLSPTFELLCQVIRCMSFPFPLQGESQVIRWTSFPFPLMGKPGNSMDIFPLPPRRGKEGMGVCFFYTTTLISFESKFLKTPSSNSSRQGRREFKNPLGKSVYFDILPQLKQWAFCLFFS